MNRLIADEPNDRDRLPAGKRKQLPAQQPASSRTPTSGKNLQRAIERAERRLSGARPVRSLPRAVPAGARAQVGVESGACSVTGSATLPAGPGLSSQRDG